MAKISYVILTLQSFYYLFVSAQGRQDSQLEEGAPVVPGSGRGGRIHESQRNSDERTTKADAKLASEFVLC